MQIVLYSSRIMQIEQYFKEKAAHPDCSEWNGLVVRGALINLPVYVISKVNQYYFASILQPIPSFEGCLLHFKHKGVF